MAKNNSSAFGPENSIPVSPTLDDIEPSIPEQRNTPVNKRLLFLSLQAIVNAICIGLIAKVLVGLISLITNIAFHGKFSFHEAAPAGHSLGLFVIIVPVIGGVIVGFMAKFWSAAIRGHGIPEAMEQILVNESKIKPIITFLKPISAAISIGTGGPFGAEGPIIATGGAFGSVTGQVMRITASERKIMLAAGATAGMAAIFGTPVAGVLLAIELLLFEFSPRSIIPVALACATGAAMHLILFGTEPVFGMLPVPEPTSSAMVIYIFLGVLVGIAATFVSKAVYYIEDLFEHLPVHWMWWPAIGAVAVGVVGYFAPYTMGVGYSNITFLLSGNVPLQMLLSLCFLKFISWVVSLGSGTSGGTLAPLLTIGGALGGLLGLAILYIFPNSTINLPTCVLVGMAAMFAGASRALLTSIVFALEATMQPHGLLPLLGACTASYFISFIFMKSSIMTEKIQRRGIATPDSFEPDVLQKITAMRVMNAQPDVLLASNTVKETRDWIKDISAEQGQTTAFIVVDENNKLLGTIKREDVFSKRYPDDMPITKLIKGPKVFLGIHNRLDTAIDLMYREGIDLLAVVRHGKVIGSITHKEVFTAYSRHRRENEKFNRQISLRREGIKIILKGKRIIDRI
jgi:H+/Cl- antiporter ClcA